MTKSRKTIKVDSLRKRVNDFNLNTMDNMTKQRESISTFLESILHDTGNYHGFNYLDSHQMKDSKEGTTVGIVTIKNGYVHSDYGKRFKDTDRTRVYYI